MRVNNCHLPSNMKLSSLLALASYLLLQLARSDPGADIYFSTITHLLRGDRSWKNITAHSFSSCIFLGCNNLRRCVGSFNKKTGACRTAILSAAPLSWTKDYLFNNSSDEDWVSFVPSQSLLSEPTPPGFWAMDASFRGRNLGTKGPNCDCSHEGLSWSSTGPLGADSDLKYARLDGTQKAKIVNKHSGIYCMDFTKPFSLGFWVKTDNRGVNFPVFDGWLTSANTYTFYIWFFPSGKENQISASGNGRYTRSTENSTNKQLWRHIAVTHDGSDYHSIYLNGAAWPISHRSSYLGRNLFGDMVNVGHRGNYVMKGSLACITYYDAQLEPEKIRAMMQNCP